MDDLASALSMAGVAPVDTAAPVHPRLADFKAVPTTASSQARRRRELRAQQRSARDQMLMARRLLGTDSDSDGDGGEDEEDVEAAAAAAMASAAHSVARAGGSMALAAAPPANDDEAAEAAVAEAARSGRAGAAAGMAVDPAAKKKKKRRRRGKPKGGGGAAGSHRFSARKKIEPNQLMLAEWMLAPPEDLYAGEWCVAFCPRAKRRLVIAAGGTTAAYTRDGELAKTFPSKLPGGHRGNKACRETDFCVLDCLHDDVHSCFYVLDIMCWGGHPVYDSDAEFRAFWVASKLAEVPEASVGSEYNPFCFFPLPRFECTPELLAGTLAAPIPIAVGGGHQVEMQLDGLLFFDRQCPYVLGTSPATLWLAPADVHTMLGIPVAPQHIHQRPAACEAAHGDEDRARAAAAVEAVSMGMAAAGDVGLAAPSAHSKPAQSAAMDEI